MPVFPSDDWCEEAARRINADPESVLAGKGWTSDIGAVVEAELGRLNRPFTVYCRPKHGVITDLKVLKDPDDLDEIEPDYLIRAPYSTWKALLLGTLDPIEAVLQRKVRVEGDMQPLIERMQYRGIAERVLAAIGTTFADDRR
jgi:putative sterol carrier protein